MTYVPVKCECGCVFWSATSHCPNCNAPVKPQARPIDANELKKRAIEMEIFMPYGGDGTTMAVEVDVIEAAPTLDYAPVRHGSWIRQDDTYTRFMCSVCKLKNYPIKYSYCPNCGAKMEE